jgi:3-deoxy-manno-octulosonate cytidylyltransferase (CMP-KDO synthetase)
LADLCGKPVIRHVYEAVARAAITDEIFVLTDAERVVEAVEAFGGRAIMTSPDCSCGTARTASIVGKITGDFIVNVQGDEPLLDHRVLVAMERRARTCAADILTPIYKITDVADLENPSIVKVAVAKSGLALYFSRSPIPFVRGVERTEWLHHHQFFGHMGVYGYRREVLENYGNLPVSELETAESLEQLRFLDGGHTIDTVVAERGSIGVDTPEDLARAKALLCSHANG